LLEPARSICSCFAISYPVSCEVHFEIKALRLLGLEAPLFVLVDFAYNTEDKLCEKGSPRNMSVDYVRRLATARVEEAQGN